MDGDFSRGSAQAFKHSLFYGYSGNRIVGYDNERGKGGHRHIDGREEAYSYSSVEALVADFLCDVRRMRGE